jgi:anti-sigma factor RsiW
MSQQAPCAAWLEAISGYLDGALAGPEEHQVHAHLRQCPACAEYLVDLVPVVQALHALPAPTPTRDPWPVLARALRQDPRYARRPLLVSLQPRTAGWVAAGVLFLATSSLAMLNYQQSTLAPTADLDMYWQQHEIYSHDEGVPSLYAPELNAIEATYQLDE